MAAVDIPPQDDAYDVAVIGSGIGGLSAAALLAAAGLRVLVAEQGEGPGGYAHAFHRGPYTIDPAIHLVGDESLFDALLRHLGVRDRCDFIRPRDLFGVALPGIVAAMPLGTLDDFVAAHVQIFPRHARAIRRFFDLCARVHREAHDLTGRLGLRDLEAAVERAPTLFKYRLATLADVLDECCPDPRVKALCGISGYILGLPPSALPFQAFAQLLCSYLADGAFYTRGGVQQVIDALAGALTRDRGDLLLRARVGRILVEGGRAVGIVLADGRRVRARVVVSNASAPQTFDELLGTEHLPAAFARQLRRLTPSVSGLVLMTATTLDLRRPGVSHQIIFSDGWDLDASYESSLQGRIAAGAVYLPTLVDPTLAPPGEHLVSALAFRPYRRDCDWARERERATAQFLAHLDPLCPDIAAHRQFTDCATPLTLERFTLNTGGAVYGWENTLRHTGSKRPAQRTPVPGLYLAGHWTQPGAGFLRAAVSGIHAAHLVLKDLGLAEAAVRFQHASLPPVAA